MARTTAFKVFTISNNIALFTSLCIVIVLVNVIPFQRKSLMRLLMVAHKAMWVAVAFTATATAYVAGTKVIMPDRLEDRWAFEAAVSICSGTPGSVFICLGVLSIRHWLMKLKWKRDQQCKAKEEENRKRKWKRWNKMRKIMNIRSPSTLM